MLRIMAVLAAAVTVAAGCGGTPAAGDPPAAPPSAAELVADAQQALRDAGTGHYEHSVLVLMGPDGTKAPSQQAAGDYDLSRRTYDGELRQSNRDLRVPGWPYAISEVATAEAVYRRWVKPAETQWHRVRSGAGQAELAPLYEPGLAPPVGALLAFRPDSTVPDDDGGDGWTVSGTLPVPAALEIVGAPVDGPSGPEKRSLRAATGTAIARLVIGADRKVRELHVAGVDIDVTSALPETTRTWLPRQSATTTFSAYGKPVSIRVPPADEVTDAPFPVFPPSA
jgi:hypothetical protein